MWRAPVVVGGRTGRAYELLERVSELPRDQRFRQIYLRSTKAVGGIPASLHAGKGVRTLPDRVHQAGEVEGESDPESSASAEHSLPAPTQRDGSRSQRYREEHGMTPPPPTRLAVLRQSLATAITQLWPWGRGPQAGPDSTGTCPAHLSNDWEGRQLAIAQMELVRVRGLLCHCIAS